jgi:hypothetical protein
VTKPLDLFQSLQQDASLEMDQSPDVQTYVANALSSKGVPDALANELAPVAKSMDVPTARMEQAQAQAMDLVSSTSFLQEVSKEIGDPREGETEDTFVIRAKEIIRKVLEKLLKG